MWKTLNFNVIDECHYVSEFDFSFRTEFIRIWRNVLKSFAKTKNKTPTLLMSESNSNESIADAIKNLKINIDPNKSFWHPSEHYLKNNISIHANCHMANRFLFRKETQRIINK